MASSASRASPASTGGLDGDHLTVEDQRFAVVPEWIIDAEISDSAFRLYAVLLRYGQTSGARMPSRATLARRLHKRSVDTVDRALKELVAAGAVVVERRRDGAQNLTNRYHVRTSTTGRTRAARAASDTESRASTTGGPSAAATTGRTTAATGSRADRAIVAATVRPDPEHLTEKTTSSPAQLAATCQQLRADRRLPVGRWTPSCIHAALQKAVQRGWTTHAAERALLAVAADPLTRSPMRLAEAGPWWDEPAVADDDTDVAELEATLDALDGYRAVLQRQARGELSELGLPLTRRSVVRKAVEIHRRQDQDRQTRSE